MRVIERFKQAQKRSGLSRATICRRVRAGQFPQPVSLGGGLLGFYSDEITQWLEDRPRIVPRHGASKDEAQPEPEEVDQWIADRPRAVPRHGESRDEGRPKAVP